MPLILEDPGADRNGISAPALLLTA